mmetsp:Transcript_108761/g.307488  ORF Transcript_108761/g.307488 Transcript_108761/m.307488 type:complete len:259 (-) Transcript_108761:8-784(-)
MPVNYSKFDHIGDSDDEKPDPKAAMEAERKEMLEQMQRRLAEAEAGDGGKAAPAKEEHQKDRFAYAEADVQKLAHELVKMCVSKTPSIKVGQGVVSVVGVEKVEGDAQMFQVRGENRFTWDLSFKAKFAYQWLGSNFDEGARRAEGQITILEFTDATTLNASKTPPIVRKAWVDKDQLDLARQKDVEKCLGGKPWPPEEGTLLANMMKTLEVFAEELPEQTRKATVKVKEEREEVAKEDAEEFEAGGGVRIEEVSSKD